MCEAQGLEQAGAHRREPGSREMIFFYLILEFAQCSTYKTSRLKAKCSALRRINICPDAGIEPTTPEQKSDSLTAVPTVLSNITRGTHKNS